jgi:hypothetical protein
MPPAWLMRYVVIGNRFPVLVFSDFLVYVPAWSGERPAIFAGQLLAGLAGVVGSASPPAPPPEPP